MEYRTRYYIEKGIAICDPECPVVSIDQKILFEDYAELKTAEVQAKKASLTKQYDYPIRVLQKQEFRDEPETGYSWKEGKGWKINWEEEEKIVSEWWEGKKVN